MGRRPTLEQTRRPRGLVSNPDAGQRVSSRRLPPIADLEDVVAELWCASWTFRGQTSHETLLLGDPAVHVVFEAGDRPDARIVGVWTRLWRRTLEGSGRVRAVKLRVGAVRAFFGEPATTFTNRITPLESVVGAQTSELFRAVTGPADDDEGLGALESWLRGHRRADDRADVGLAVALAARIARDTTITSVKRLAEVSGLSLRAVQRLFRVHVGASPKAVIRRHRLQEVAARIELGERSSLAHVAAELGYADHAHLARDFRKVIGISPAEFRVRRGA